MKEVYNALFSFCNTKAADWDLDDYDSNLGSGNNHFSNWII